MFGPCSQEPPAPRPHKSIKTVACIPVKKKLCCSWGRIQEYFSGLFSFPWLQIKWNCKAASKWQGIHGNAFTGKDHKETKALQWTKCSVCINLSNTPRSTVEPPYTELINNKIPDITNKLPVYSFISFKTVSNHETIPLKVRTSWMS